MLDGLVYLSMKIVQGPVQPSF